MSGRGGSHGGRQAGNAKRGARRNENNKIYAYPLPLLLEPRSSLQWASNLLGIFSLSSDRIVKPQIEGQLDVATRSVWVTNSSDAMLLWRRGFFGKGNLSRSEPSWLARQLNQRKINAAGGVTAEEITAKRRAERKQFKLDRARAMAEAAMEAEEAFAASGVVLEGSSVAIPSAATWKPTIVNVNEAETKPPGTPVDEDDIPDEELKDIEHLQLTLQEAFFLIWTMDCLSLLDPDTDGSFTLPQIWRSFQNAHSPNLTLSSSLLDATPTRFDNPFLVNYVAFHHYRSLGWVVKGGIKFCVDYLLYKRGPVFSHAEFAIVICPVYEDPEDREMSPFHLQNVDPFTWSWLSTINRVNSQVQKTLVLAYVTIPASSRLPSDILSSPACLAHYSIREVIVRRFIPARMRDQSSC